MDYLIGHFVGDILFQNRWLSYVKKRTLLGLLLHCLIVSASIALCAWRWDLSMGLTFLSHLLIDGLGLGKRWWPYLTRQGLPGSDEVPASIGLWDDQILHLVALWLIFSL